MDPLSTPPQNLPQQINLIDVPVTDETISLNLMVQFLNVAQKRGTFSIAESAKIFECIRIFINQSQNQVPPSQDSDIVSATVGEEGELELKN